MASFISNLLNNNLFENCVNDSFISLHCILGSSTFIFSILITSFDCYAFYKLFKFFHKINFEASLILLNIIQIVLIQLLIITNYEILIECFNLVQNIMLTWIIRKFNILLTNPEKSFQKNIFFIVLNIINLSIIIYYIVLLFLEEFNDYHYITILFHNSFSFLCSLILTIYCCSLINKLKKINDKEKNSFQTLIDSPEESNNIIFLDKNEESNKKNDFIFYSQRERQIKPLYKINLICTFLELLLVLSNLFVTNINFRNNSYKVIPETSMSHIFYYIFIFVCIINTFTNFFCFFWRIKNQYKMPLNKKNKKSRNNNLYKQNPFQIEDIIENDFIKKVPDEKEKSEFTISFNDLSIDNSNNTKMNKIQEKSKDFNINENYKDNEINNRESIPLDIDAQKGINRITRNTFSSVEEEK